MSMYDILRLHCRRSQLLAHVCQVALQSSTSSTVAISCCNFFTAAVLIGGLCLIGSEPTVLVGETAASAGHSVRSYLHINPVSLRKLKCSAHVQLSMQLNVDCGAWCGYNSTGITQLEQTGMQQHACAARLGDVSSPSSSGHAAHQLPPLQHCARAVEMRVHKLLLYSSGMLTSAAASQPLGVRHD